MARTVYVQSGPNGQAYSPSGAVASRGFAFLGYDVKYFLPEELPDLALSPEVIVVGGMGTTRAAIERVAGHLPTLSGVPAGCSADFGVAGDGRTLLVEINDGHSLGCGALVANLYAKLLEARWDEIVG